MSKKIALPWRDVNPPYVYVGRNILGESNDYGAGWAIHEDESFEHHNPEAPYYAEFRSDNDESLKVSYGNFASLTEAKNWVDENLTKRGWILVDQTNLKFLL